jgi:hypothetical protein
MNWADPQTLAPVYEIPKLDGKGMTKRISIDRAAEMGLIPRVTGVVEDMLGKGYPLMQYLKRKATLAARDNDQYPEETDTEYIDRIDKLADTDARRARRRGSEVHRLVSTFLTTDEPPEDKAARLIGSRIIHLLRTLKAEEVMSEQPLTREGLCGSPDILIMSPRKHILDIKVTDADVTRVYRDHAYQMGGYMELSDAVSATVLYCNPWTGEVNPLEADRRYRAAFVHIWDAWREENYWARRILAARGF